MTEYASEGDSGLEFDNVVDNKSVWETVKSLYNVLHLAERVTPLL